MSHKTDGTKEWAANNLNIQERCPNNCKYCYACRMALRFKRIKSKREWGLHPKIKINKIKKGYRKLSNSNGELYNYMFPSSHDIIPENLYYCVKVLKKVLGAGNTVLITTKPDPFCIKKLCSKLANYKNLICFRFTVTSAWNPTLRKYEPHAPSFQMRKNAIMHAFKKGFKTSLSIEPLLQPTPIPIINILSKYINDEIWIGIMSGKIPKKLKGIYSRPNLRAIYLECSTLSWEQRKKIRFKDSIVNKINLEENRFEE